MTYWDGRYFASGIVIIEVGTVVVQGAIREIRFQLGTATKSSTTQIPGSSRILYTAVQIIDVYDAGARISIGHSGDDELLMTINDNTPQQLGTYVVDNDVLFPGVATSVLATVTGSPTNGSAIVIVRHSQPET